MAAHNRAGGPFAIRFALSDDSTEDLRNWTGDTFGGYEVEGSLAVCVNGKWFGGMRGRKASEEPEWFEGAYLWNFIWDLVHACLGLMQGRSQETVEFEEDIFSMRLDWDGVNVAMSQLISPYAHENQLKLFRDHIHNERVDATLFFRAVADAADALLNQMVSLNRKLAAEDYNRRLRNSIKILKATYASPE